VDQSDVSSPSSPCELEPVTFWPRAGARVVDYAVIIGISLWAAFAAGLLATAFGVEEAFGNAVERETKLAERIFEFVAIVAYHTVFEGVSGSTAGKRLLGMQVIHLNAGEPLRLAQAFKRSVAFLVDGFLFGAVGAAAMRRNPERQRNGDGWADTRVVTRASLPHGLRTHGFLIFAGAVGAFVVTAAVTALRLAIAYHAYVTR
jgi:uncharacterized RDD family membrane protein YckC